MLSWWVRIDCETSNVKTLEVSHSFFRWTGLFRALFLLLSKADGGEIHTFKNIFHCQYEAQVCLIWFLPDPKFRLTQTKTHWSFPHSSSFPLRSKTKQSHKFHDLNSLSIFNPIIHLSQWYPAKGLGVMLAARDYSILRAALGTGERSGCTNYRFASKIKF